MSVSTIATNPANFLSKSSNGRKLRFNFITHSILSFRHVEQSSDIAFLRQTVRRGGNYAQCSATLENILMDGKQLYILGKHGEVASLRLGHLRGIITGLRLARGCLRPRAGTRRLYLYPQAQRVTNTRSADAASVHYSKR
jgi:hypothetical protein